MATTITMPQLGETVTEGTVAQWLKNVGDNVEKYEAFVEVSTDKVNAEVPSPVTGTIRELLVKEGETGRHRHADRRHRRSRRAGAAPPAPSAPAAVRRRQRPPPRRPRRPQRRRSPRAERPTHATAAERLRAFRPPCGGSRANIASTSARSR